MVLAGPPLQVAKEIALHGRRPDAFPPAQTASIDAVQVLLKDHFLKALAGPLEGLNAWGLLAEGAAAIKTAPLSHLQLEDTAPEAPVVMPDAPIAPALVPQMGTSAVGARYRPGMPGRYRNRAAASLDLANLVLGQT